MVHILFLAAGSSSRFGENKLLALFRQKPLYQHGLSMLAELCARRQDCDLTVITQNEIIAASARAMGAAAVDSPRAQEGISRSVQAGVWAVQPIMPADYLMFVPADQPLLSVRTVEAMLYQAKKGCVAATACWHTTPGSPTLFCGRIAPGLMQLKGDKGGRSLLKSCPDKVVWVQVQNRWELQDADTPQMLKMLENAPI